MTAKFFVDTNVLIYAASNAVTDQPRRDLALDLLDRSDLVFSAQVLAEFYSVATSKTKLNMPPDEALLLLESLAGVPTYPITRDLVIEAANVSRRFKISYWDAAILTAARLMGCGVVYSEDLNDGQDYDGVRVVNPFAAVS
jgi:predicted nucleic acid-binding protein